MSAPSWRFRGTAFLVLLAPLLVGFLASAAANRLIFAGWALGVALMAGSVLALGRRSRWNGWLHAGRTLFSLAIGAALFARLVETEHEALDLGLRALLGDLYRESWSDPRAVLGVAIAIAVTGVLCVLVSHGVDRRSDARRGEAR